MTQYDGSINIDTKIDTEGFNQDAAKIGKSISKVMKAVLKGLKIAGVAAGILAVLGVVILAGFLGLVRGAMSFVRWAERMTETLYKSLAPTSAMRQEVVVLQSGFEAVKGSIQAMAATLLHALAPAILKIIDFLVRAINFVAIFIASLAGLDKAMIYVSGAADEGAKGTGAMADNMERTKGAAEGALAAFDELNVLPQAQEAAGGGAGLGGKVTLTEVDVPEGFAQNVWDKIVEYWELVIVPAFKQSWRDFWTGIWEFLRGLIITELKIMALPFVAIAALAVWLWFKIKEAFSKIGPFFKKMGEGLKAEWGRIWTSIKMLAVIFYLWLLTKIIWPIRNKFAEIVETIKEKWETAFEGIKTFVKGIINSIIGFLNSMIAGLVSGINVAIRALNKLSVSFPDWFPGDLGGKSFGINITELTAPTIPLLAAGAVIPPNSPFAAILGDQRSGTNIEAPESLLREIIQDELGQIQGDFTFNFGGSMSELVRVMKPYVEKENVRVGESLVQRSTP
jgi:hypothetical protein